MATTFLQQDMRCASVNHSNVSVSNPTMSDCTAGEGPFWDGLKILIDTIPDGATCPICLNTMDAAPHGQVVETRCGHAFHYNCLHGWLSQNKNSCPICRQIFPDICSAPNSIGYPDDISDDEPLLDGIEPFSTWYSYAHQPSQASDWGDLLSVDASQRAVDTTEQYRRAQQQRVMLLQQLAALVQEKELLSHAELQSSRRILNGEHEEPDTDQRARLSELRMRQDLLFQGIQLMDAMIEELLLEEERLRGVVDFDNWIGVH